MEYNVAVEKRTNVIVGKLICLADYSV